MTELRNVAVILAGGTGTRVGLSIPKQLIKIAGKTIIEHTIAAFEASPLVDEIVILMAPGHLDPVRAIVQNGGYGKVSQIVEGGQKLGAKTGRRDDDFFQLLAERAGLPRDRVFRALTENAPADSAVMTRTAADLQRLLQVLRS